MSIEVQQHNKVTIALSIEAQQHNKVTIEVVYSKIHKENTKVFYKGEEDT